MNPWTLCQFKNIVNAFIDKCDKVMQADIIERLDFLSEKGNLCKRPASAPLGGGLFELRVKSSKKQVRLLYYFEQGQKITFVHALIKKTQRLSSSDIETAERNRRTIEEGRERSHGIDLTH